MRTTTIVFAGIALLACRRPDEQGPLRSQQVATTATAPLAAGTLPPQASDTGSNRVTITSPTIIVAFPRPSPTDSSGGSSQEASEAYDDWSYYADKALRFLKARGVHTVFLLTDTVRVIEHGQEIILPVSNGPLVYFARQGRPGRELPGYDSDATIIDAAADYFWAGKVPNAVGDTLTAPNAHADFAVARPTIIAFFSRRDLEFDDRKWIGREYPDSARIVQQVESLRDSLDRSGVTIDLTFKHRFTVFERGRVDTIRTQAVKGFYVTAPNDWGGQFWIGPRQTPELVQDIREYLNKLRSTTPR